MKTLTALETAGPTDRRESMSNQPEPPAPTQPSEVGTFIEIIFDASNGPMNMVFVEVENEKGQSVNVGEWHNQAEGYSALRIPLGQSTAGSQEGRDVETYKVIAQVLQKLEGRLREVVLSARKAFECVRLNDKTVYNYEGAGAKNKDGRIPENGRWSTPLEIAEDEIKLIDKALTASPEVKA